MVVLETMIGFAILILVYIAYTVSKNKSEKKDSGEYGNIMNEMGVFKRMLIEKKEEKEEREKGIKEERKILMEILQTMTGTTRGGVGEQHVKNALSPLIKMGVVVENLSMGSKKVEFAWNIGDGKYIPIDSKLPQVEELSLKYEKTEDTKERRDLKKKIYDKIRSHVMVAGKYKNQSNTTDKVLVAIPDSLMDIVIPINAEFNKKGIHVCGYSYIALFGFMLSEAYKRITETGDIGFYEQAINELIDLMNDIEGKTNSIERSIKTIKNANEDIKGYTFSSHKFKNKKKKNKKIMIKEKH